MGQFIFFHDMPHSDTQVWEAAIGTATRSLTLALAKPEAVHPESGFLTPTAVCNLVDQDVQVVMQFGFANHNPISDSDYADVGADFLTQFVDLAMLCPFIMKFDAFTLEQITLSKENRILFSILSPENITEEYIKAVNGKNITMICLDLYRNGNGDSLLDRFHKEALSDAGFQITLSNFLLPLAETLIHAPSIPYALQRSPDLMQGVLCHAGTLCHQQTAEKLHLPWRDILSLCWNLN